MVKVGEMTKEAFVAKAKENGLDEVTDEEWAKHAEGRKWSLTTAMNRIRNDRRGVLEQKEVQVLIGYPLGGRMIVPRGKDIDDKDVVGQSILFINKELNSLEELTCYGSFKGKNRTLCELEVEVTTKQGLDGTDYENRVIKGVTVKDQRLKVEQLKSIALKPAGLTKGMVYKSVILDVAVTPDFDREPIWGPKEDGEGNEVKGGYKLNFNDLPCFQVKVLGDVTDNMSIIFRAPPGKHNVFDHEMEDLEEVIKDDKLDDLVLSYSRKTALVAGTITRYSEGRSAHFVTVMGHALYITGEYAPPDSGGGGEPIEDVREEVKGKLDEIKVKVKEAMDLLGNDTTVQGIKELNKDLEAYSDEVISAVKENIIAESKQTELPPE